MTVADYIKLLSALPQDLQVTSYDTSGDLYIADPPEIRKADQHYDAERNEINECWNRKSCYFCQKGLPIVQVVML